MKYVDVAIIGAGPVGMLLAIELSLTGTSCLLLEADREPEDVQKALSIGPLGAEALMRRGFGAELDAMEARTVAMTRPSASSAGGGWARPLTGAKRFSGHFAGIPLPAQEIDGLRPTRFIDQRFLQQMLLADIVRRDIPFWRSCRVTGIEQRQDGVMLDLSHDSDQSDARCRKLSCRYVVGCDGGRSFLRKQGGFAFPGTLPSLGFYQVFATFEHVEDVPQPGWQMQPGGVLAYGPIPDRLFLVDFSGPPAEDVVPDRVQVEQALARVCGRPIALKDYHGGRCWTDHTRLVDTYRKGNMFLAGDAAHIHAPFGGQGLGLGLCDAANLGWKLGAVLSGRAPQTLLDSYTTERRPVAEAVLANTQAQTALMRPDRQSRALRSLMVDMLAKPSAGARLSAEMKGFAIRYDPGGVFCDDDTQTGALVADRVLADGRSLYALMQDGAAILLHPAGEAPPPVSLPERVIAAEWTENSLALIRPDGCLAWQGDRHDRAECQQALTRWFGMGPASVP